MNTMTPQPEKERLRQTIRMQREACPAPWLHEQSQRIQQQVMAMPEFINAETIASYMALPHEVQTDLLHQICFNQHKTIVIPCHNKCEYGWAQLHEDTPLIPRYAGVREPAHPTWMTNIPFDLILVPVVGVDYEGHRLGHGGGHYDRLLHHTHSFKLALAFDFQFVASIPSESWDIPMDAMVTPTISKRFLQVHKT